MWFRSYSEKSRIRAFTTPISLRVPHRACITSPWHATYSKLPPSPGQLHLRGAGQVSRIGAHPNPHEFAGWACQVARGSSLDIASLQPASLAIGGGVFRV